MNIVFVIDQVYRHGGIERVLSIKANYFSALKGHKVYIITTEQKQQKACYSFNDNIVFEDLNINYKRNKSYFHPINVLKIPKHINNTKKVLKRIKPDVVVVCSHSVDTYFMPFIYKTIPKVKEFHYSKFIEEPIRQTTKITFKKLFFLISDYIETKYDQIVILNKDESKYYKSNNVTVIPNPLTFFPQEVSKLSNKIIISAGRIASVKGFDLLIDIWKIAHTKLPNWKLCIFGEGYAEYTQTLQNKIVEANLEESIIFKGPTNRMEEHMLQASLYAMTSHNECFPLVLLEAQACGLPIISFDCPHGPRNIINHKTGVLIPLGDNTLYANQLISLANDKKKLKIMGVEARNNAYNYGLDKIMRLWINLFQTLSTNKVKSK